MASLIVLLIVVTWFGVPRGIVALDEDYCVGGNPCFCDPDISCCAKDGCSNPPPPECQTAAECGYGGHLACPGGQASNGTCQACTCTSCYYYYTERDDGKSVRRCSSPSFDAPECCGPVPGSCIATPPTDMGIPLSDTPSNATLHWTPGDFGYEQRMRIGQNFDEVKVGCPGSNGGVAVGSPLCKAAFSYPTYTPPTNTFSPAITMYYFKKRGPIAADGTYYKLDTCVPTSSTYATISACEENFGSVCD